MYMRTDEGLGQGITPYINVLPSSYIGELSLSTEAAGPGYEKREIEISRTPKGHLASDVSLHERGLLIADFGVDRRSVKKSVRKDKLLKDWLDSLVRDPAAKLRIFGYSDSVGNEKHNKKLRRHRAERVEQLVVELLGKRARSLIIYKGPAPLGSYVADNSTVEGRAKNRGVIIELSRQIIVEEPMQITACRYDIANASAIEVESARRTLGLSAQVANRFISNVGALSARGRFIPTVIDNKYWFAKLYELITYYEIAEASSLHHPGFVLHFIPIFYDLYYRALENWTAGNRAAVSSLWGTHFTRASRPDNSSIQAWMDGVRVSIVTGVTAHVQGDMATALDRAYRSYVAKYCLSPQPRFDEFRPDFFERNRIVFERSKAAFFLHLSQFSPFPVGPEWGQFLFAVGEPLAGGLDVDEVYRWRSAAWSKARRRLGQ